jgi:hypothetical protein
MDFVRKNALGYKWVYEKIPFFIDFPTFVLSAAESISICNAKKKQ